MSTEFFLTDEQHMSEAEIADARSFDESALICQKSKGPTGAVFTLEVPSITFYNLPRNARVVNNNNNLVINTVGDLIDATREETSRVIPRHEVEQDAKAELAELRDERKFKGEREGFLPEQLPPSRSRVAEYARRIRRQIATA